MQEPHRPSPLSFQTAAAGSYPGSSCEPLVAGMQQLPAIFCIRAISCNLCAAHAILLPDRSKSRLSGGEKRMLIRSHMLGGLSLLALAAAAPAAAQDAPSGSYDGNETDR